jgi:hypothetical protein
VVEADLAFQGIDLRDLYRPGSGLTPRRLLVLIRALPPTATLWAVLEHAEKQAQIPTVERIRERQDFYAAKGDA